jgi:hypothetical protein
MSWVYELPFAHYGYDSEYSDESDNAIGNPYLGVEFYGEGSPIFGEIGLRLPLAPDFDNGAVFIGYFTDFVDRVEAFVPDVLTASGFVNYMKREPSGFFSRLRCGLTLLVATEKHAESDQCLLYSAQAGYESEEAGFMAGVSGRYVLSEEDGDFGEKTNHQLGLAVSFAAGAVHPGISIRVPLDEDLSDWLDFVFGLTLGVPIR